MKIQRLIIIGFLVIIALGRLMPMTLMLEPDDPWYLRYTTIWFIAAGILFYPPVFISQAIGFSIERSTFLIVDAVWLSLVCLAIYHWPTRRERPNL